MIMTDRAPKSNQRTPGLQWSTPAATITGLAAAVTGAGAKADSAEMGSDTCVVLVEPDEIRQEYIVHRSEPFELLGLKLLV